MRFRFTPTVRGRVEWYDYDYERDIGCGTVVMEMLTAERKWSFKLAGLHVEQDLAAIWPDPVVAAILAEQSEYAVLDARADLRDAREEERRAA